MTWTRIFLGILSVALLATPARAAQAAPNCEEWNTIEFFLTATVEDVTACLAGGADLTDQTNDGRTLLHLAAQNNQNPAVIAALLAAGADVNARNDDGNTPMHLNAEISPYRNQNPAVTKALLDAGSDLTARNEGGRTPMDVVADGKNPAVIAALLAAGADTDLAQILVSEDDNETLLHYAARYTQHPAVIEGLLAAGADPNVLDYVDRTPLHRAADNENPAVIAALLAAGADPEARNNLGESPLHRAARYNPNPAVIEGRCWPPVPIRWPGATMASKGWTLARSFR